VHDRRAEEPPPRARDHAAVGETCTLSGRATGPEARAATLFNIALYGPNQRDRYHERGRFNASGQYAFRRLPQGQYWLLLDTRADIKVTASPRERVVTCRGGSVTNLDFAFR
jgi:hypothetical protein